ncbi:bifunctional non-homologous end joining protein LigD [Rhizobium subbaraonis]|uniref:DNA ligase (ATP) n=2 Tax=Rhizobium subbaraonis TaxID=908946 RepID=A0A285U5V6_9HYPH|nr:bifunctional non-homologous end joining protein LigD [Rhizobium subbaraonis]
MPARIEPCLALLVSKPPSGPQWSFEVKWDGYRLAVHKEPTGARVITRGGHDWTDRFPAIAAAAGHMDCDTMILDGEAVVLDEQGRSDFGALQQSLGGRGGKRLAGDALFLAFDLLYLNGHDLTRMPQSERRAMLDAILHVPGGSIRFSEDIGDDGAELLKTACGLGLEGIIGKNGDKPYRSGRLGDWVKVKCVQSEGFAIVGYEPSRNALGGIGRLLLAARKGDSLVYVGGVGTGFTARSGAALRRQLDAIAIPKPAIDVGKRKAVFVPPTIVAEVEFRAWTHDGILRHASFKGTRDSADSGDVFRVEVDIR